MPVPGRVSVVISTRNRPVKLLAALRSVQAQTYPDWEVVVVGDNCASETVKAISSFNDARVRYYNTAVHYGLSDHGSTPKNLGIEHSFGEFIAYLDDDDVYLPEHLASSIEFLNKNENVDLVYGCSQVFKFLDARRFVLRDREFDKTAHDQSPFINTCEVVHRRSLLDKLTDGWWRAVGYYNDYDLLKRVSNVGVIAHSKHVAATQHFNMATLTKMESDRLRRRGQQTPVVSVIIGVRGRTKYLIECIKGLDRQVANRQDFEVIVVDQGDGAESQDCCSLFPGRIMHVALHDAGPFHRGWVCNVGVKRALGRILCFLDCDCVVTPDFIQSIIDREKEEVDDKYLFRIKRKWLPEQDSSAYFAGRKSFSECFVGCDLDPNVTAIGSGMCVPRSVFFSIGGFDEMYDKGWGFEDVDIKDRLVAFGCRTVEDFPGPLQMHLWHTTSDHDRVHRGEHYVYYKKMSRIGRRGGNFIFRNQVIDWGSIAREIVSF